MTSLLCLLTLILIFIIIILILKLVSIRRAADELREAFADRLKSDTNVGIAVSTSDQKMRSLAADMDRQLKLLRTAQLNYMQGDRELKAAVTNMSHDLRTPLTAICGYMELIKQEPLPDKAKSYLDIIENRVQALKNLTEELFRYSVILSADFDTEKENLSLNAALEETAAAYYGALKNASIEPQIYIPESGVRRLLNRQALMRILANLMDNAIKYSNNSLSITLTPDGTITFRNQADTLDELTAGRLFDRFFTVESGERSTGLGLSIAKTLTEEMGGSIKADFWDGFLSIMLYFPAN
ncbi:MAG: HAMP domain-containing histidine kinase [Lachnospiraceae bacterium]|nr:HAMP domain-containing histidine kinase [Lachnospiraceae bacterium]